MQPQPASIPFAGFGAPQMPPMMMQPHPVASNQTLYIGNLDKNVTENQIYDRFSKFGKIVRFQIMRDKVRNESRGFAFIEFQNLKDAEAAKNTMNNEMLQTRYMRVMWKGDHKKAATDGNVFVKDIDPKITQNELETYFQQFGPVLSTHLSVNDKGQSNRYGFVQFRSADDAKKCIELFQSESEKVQPLGESGVRVDAYKNKNERETAKPEVQRNLYLKDLPESITIEEIREVFGNSNISNAIANPCKEAGAKWALVAFNSTEHADAALAKFNGATNVFKNQTKPLYICWHKNRKQLKEERRKARDADRELVLYMRDLKADKTKADIEKVLTALGTTFNWINLKPFEATESPNSNVKYNTQYAFIKMTAKEHVQTVLGKKAEKEVEELFIKGRPFIDIAMPKADRERMKQIQQRQRVAPFVQGFPYMMQQQRFPPMGMFPPQMPWQMQQPPRMGGGPQAYGPRPPMRGGPRGPPRGGFGGQRQGPPRGAGMPGQHYGGHRGGPHQQHTPMPQQHHQMGGQPMQMAPAPQPQREAPKPAAPAPEAPKKLDLATIRKNWDNFLKMKADDKRNVLGEFLYPKVEKIIGRNLAPKITGMLVDFEVMTEDEIVEAIENEEILKQRITEAREALDEAEQQ